jgi:cell division transport system permease protein
VRSAFARALRGMREHTYLSVVSTGVIAAALVLVGIFALALVNLRAVVGAWEQDAHISAYLKADLAPAAHPALVQAVAGLPDVADVRYVASADAHAWMIGEMPDMGPVLAELGDGTLPASIEITLKREATSPERMAAFVDQLRGAGAYSDVDFGQEWVTRFNTFLSVVTALGVAVGGFVAVAALFLVANTIHLVVYTRRDELEIMRLVGATDGWIVAPFLVEGALQGVLAAMVSIGLLYGVHAGLLAQMDAMLAVGLGTDDVRFLSPLWLGGLVAAGVALGTGAAWGATRRFLSRLP